MHLYERTDQISGGIWSVNETGFTGFEVDQCKHSFGHNSADLQRIVTKFWSSEPTGQKLSYANLVA